jgi:hypothetical protein
MASSGMLRRAVPVRTDSHVVLFRSVHLLLVRANVVPSSEILVNLLLEALQSSETSVLSRVTRFYI